MEKVKRIEISIINSETLTIGTKFEEYLSYHFNYIQYPTSKKSECQKNSEVDAIFYLSLIYKKENPSLSLDIKNCKTNEYIRFRKTLCISDKKNSYEECFKNLTEGLYKPDLSEEEHLEKLEQRAISRE
ncbi:MAG: hypothetical protein H7A25_10915 [Leptospiraceae bacterium]|nr:hypothetical protein [Leptospiraceae bacterium]